MSATKTGDSCEGTGVKAARQSAQVCLVALWLAVTGGAAVAQEETNAPAATNAPASASAQTLPSPDAAPPPRAESTPSRLDESAFRIVSERNIFDANRSGGQVRLASRRAPRVESFALVGTLAYEKGAYAFFEGSSSELTKVLKADGVIAGHKLVDILVNGVKLEADGKITDLPVGSAMRREDEGAWHPGDPVAGSSGSAPRGEEEAAAPSRGREERNGRSESRDHASSGGAPSSSTSSADQAEVLKRLMERREKD